MKLSTQILIALSIVILLSVADSYTNYLLSLKVEKNAKFLSRSEAVIRTSNKIHTTLIEMQSAFRGYLLTDNTSFLYPYETGIKTVPGLLAEQKELIKENPLQHSIFDSIHTVHGKWINYANSLIDARKKIPQSASAHKIYDKLFENKLKKGVGKSLTDTITTKFLEFDKSEYRLRDMRGRMLISSIKRTHTFSFIFLTLTIIVGISSTIFIISIISKRIKSMVNLAENITKGDFNIIDDRRNDELTGLSHSLNIMSERLSTNIRDLENRNAELNKFAYVVSHDLKAPVRGIHNVIKWIEEDLGQELSPEMKKYLEIIPQRTKRMEDLINGLLDYAKISEKSHSEETDTNALVKEISDAIVPRHYKIEINDLPDLFTERLKLEQVFTNLISNAVKNTSRSNGHIVITCKDLGDKYEFSVKDNGIGIDPLYHKKIFEIFQTLRERNEKESTGVGLAIVKKIIEEQHGTITVISKAGEGAEFIFTWRKNKKL